MSKYAQEKKSTEPQSYLSYIYKILVFLKSSKKFYFEVRV